MQLMPLPQCQLQCGRFTLDLSQPQMMGILNVTPDSFSDGGQHHQKDLAIQHALQMIEEGASIIDIGGESTRPNASPVELEEEIQRVIPVVEALSNYGVIISIDTSQPEVIRAAVQAGAHIWNDVRAHQVHRGPVDPRQGEHFRARGGYARPGPGRARPRTGEDRFPLPEQCAV